MEKCDSADVLDDNGDTLASPKNQVTVDLDQYFS